MSVSSLKPTDKFILDGAYELLLPVGRGKNSVVYKARCLPNAPVVALNGKLIALKVLLQEGKDDGYAINRTKREALALLASAHPNVVRLIDYVAKENLCYIAMEYLVRSDLKSILDRQKYPFSVQQALQLTRQILLGLETVHSAGIVHRDIKPENLLLTEDFVVKIADFGVATVPAHHIDQEESGKVIGTFDYLAPEALQKGVSNQQTDLYAVAVTCFQLITKQLPFTGTSFTEQISKKLSGQRQHARKLIKGLPPLIDSLFAKALAPDPERRFKSAVEFRLAIEAFGVGEWQPEPVLEIRPSSVFKRDNTVSCITKNTSIIEETKVDSGLAAISTKELAAGDLCNEDLSQEVSNDDSIRRLPTVSDADFEFVQQNQESDLSDSQLLRKVGKRASDGDINLGSMRFFSWVLKRKASPSFRFAMVLGCLFSVICWFKAPPEVAAAMSPVIRAHLAKAEGYAERFLASFRSGYSLTASVAGMIGIPEAEIPTVSEETESSVQDSKLLAEETGASFSSLNLGNRVGLLYALMGDETDISISTSYNAEVNATVIMLGIPGAEPLVLPAEQVDGSELVVSFQGLLISLTLEPRTLIDGAFLGGSYKELVSGRSGSWRIW